MSLNENFLNNKLKFINNTIQYFAQIDSHIGLALKSRNEGWTRPNVIEDSSFIKLKEMWNPLVMATQGIEFVRNTYEPPEETPYIDTDKKKEHEDVRGVGAAAEAPTSNLLVLTGPNGSGKSIYLKSIFLIVYMSKIGCFVPCKQATIGSLLSGIFAFFPSDDIFHHESIREFSKFQDTCFQIKTLLNKANDCPSSCLVLIDEFGPGTIIEDGMALVSGLCHYILEWKKKSKIYAIMTTHYHELFESPYFFCDEHLNNYYIKTKRLCLYSMDVKFNENYNTTNGKTDINLPSYLEYQYNLVSGLSSTSYAAECSFAQGITLDVIHRYEQLIATEKKKNILNVQLKSIILDYLGNDSNKISADEDMLNKVLQLCNK